MSISPIPGRTTAPIPAATMLGYQAEGARTNLCLQSNTFSSVSWTNNNLPSPAQNVIGPDGATSGWTLTNDATNAEHRIYQNVGAAAQRTASIYAKAGTASFIALSTVGGPSAYSVFNLSTGAVSATVGGTATITPAYPAGWYRCTFTETGSAGQFFVLNVGESAANAVPGTAYVGTGKTVLVAFSQAEAATSASSYIPTTTIAVARNADVLTYSGADVPLLKTLAMRCTPVKVSSGAYQVALQLDDGTGNERHLFAFDIATPVMYAQSIDGGAVQSTINSGTKTAGVEVKASYSFAANDMKADFDGTAGTPDTSGTMPSGITTMRIGGGVAGAAPFNGPVNHIYGWTRNLSQSELGAVDR